MTPKPQELPKLYSMFSIGLVTFFCSLLAGGYLLYANYKALGMRKMARYVLAATIALFAVFLWALSAYIEGASNTAEELPQLPITDQFSRCCSPSHCRCNGDPSSSGSHVRHFQRDAGELSFNLASPVHRPVRGLFNIYVYGSDRRPYSAVDHLPNVNSCQCDSGTLRKRF